MISGELLAHQPLFQPVTGVKENAMAHRRFRAHLDPGAPEVDEIIPVSLGGDPLKWSNVQLAHRLCNQRKSNRTTAEHPAQAEPDRPTTSRHW